jgi:hypothetical protein
MLFRGEVAASGDNRLQVGNDRSAARFPSE